MGSHFEALRKCIEGEEVVGVATIVSGEQMGRKALFFPDGRIEGDLGLSEVKDQIDSRIRELLSELRTDSFVVSGPGDVEIELFFEVHEPIQRLIVIGAVHVAIPLVSIAKTLGFYTVVVDARSVFATEERFPHADELIVRWPGEAIAEMNLNDSTYCAFLSHDAKLDNPALAIVLRRPVRYVGALGSRKTHAKRVEELRDLGLSEEEIARIHAPIGMDLGGSRPEEIALSIAAEMVAARCGRA